jgi:hypothetical protein
MRKQLLYVLALFLIILPISQALGQPPRLLPYQGMLKDNSGNPRPDGMYQFTFSLYDSNEAQRPLWSETKMLKTNGGFFYTFLGDQIQFPDIVEFNKQFWLGFRINNEPERTPRVSLGKDSYSFYALFANTAQSLVPNASITDAHIAADAKIADTKIAGTGNPITGMNADMVDGMHAEDLQSPVSQVVRGVVTFGGNRYETTEYFWPPVDPTKSFVVLGLPVIERYRQTDKQGNREAVQKAASLISLTSNTITIAIDEPSGLFDAGLAPHRVSFQIIEFK